MTRTLSTPAGPFTTERRRPAGIGWSVLAVVSAGGVLGALARYGIGVALPADPGAFPWATFVVNASGCLAIGVLMSLVTDARLVRPFLGTGVLGGYTTFSAYVVEAQQLVEAGAARTALAYLGGTVVTALSAVYAGTALARLAKRGRATRGRRSSTEAAT